MKNSHFILLVILISTLKSNAQFADSNTTLKKIKIHFTKGSVFLNSSSKKDLDSVTKIASHYTNYKLKLTGFDAYSCELCYQRIWDRIYSVRKYLIFKGVPESRIIFAYSDSTVSRLVTLEFTKEDGPSFLPAPHPCYSFHHLTSKRCKDLENHIKLPID